MEAVPGPVNYPGLVQGGQKQDFHRRIFHSKICPCSNATEIKAIAFKAYLTLHAYSLHGELQLSCNNSVKAFRCF